MDNLDTRRHLRWDLSYNIRDLGGYATHDGRQLRWRALVRADNLYRLTPQGQTALRDYGIRTLIDLRLDYELELSPSPFAAPRSAASGPRYLHLPLYAGASNEGIAAVEAYRSLQDYNRLVLEHYRAGIAAVITAFADAPAGGVLVSCHAGKDRTGLIVALILALAGVPYPTIAADYALSDTYLQPLYAEWLAGEPDAARRARLAEDLTSSPETMLAALAHLESLGGVQAYLLDAGVSPEQVERLRERLLTAPASP